MNDERRYSEDEVARILDEATEVQASGGALGPGSAGLTLTELKEIAVEAGIPAEAVERAAVNLDRPLPVTTPEQKFLGQTIGLGRSVKLPRRMTDQEWNQLVIDLRMTFDAKGKIRDEGAFRQWTNSNLQALLEPTPDGEQLRLRTVKGNARTFQGMGAGFLGGSVVLSVLNVLGMARDPSDIGIFAAMGAAFFLGSRLTVPAWAKTRARQFEEIIARAQATVRPIEPGSEAGRLGAPDGPGGWQTPDEPEG